MYTHKVILDRLNSMKAYESAKKDHDDMPQASPRHVGNKSFFTCPLSATAEKSQDAKSWILAHYLSVCHVSLQWYHRHAGGEVRCAEGVITAVLLCQGGHPGPPAGLQPGDPQQTDLLRGGHHQRLPRRQTCSAQGELLIWTICRAQNLLF